MNLAQLLPDLDEVPESLVDESIFDSFVSWARTRGIELYPAQEEAALGLVAGDNVVLATPTGSGKSMVAIAAHFTALERKQRSFYTAPIKALVSEKFFALCDVFGPDNVGMMTGDATVNGNAPIICATAEIVANIALRDGASADVDQLVMDEFHYYSDPERGWAWQVPLLELAHTQFLLMSGTLGDTTALREDLSRRTGRATSLVGADAPRPVPLEFSYALDPVHETIEKLLDKGRAPIYVVHFSQREATERAQALTSLNLVTKEEQERLREEIGSFRFTTSFGKILSKLVRRGIGVHHAGLLPKYRRLVERLSQTGLLKVICGTDTLGVGINVPIRTVLMTGLAKFDGRRQRVLKSREFHQIAGRAGRAGFDTVGYVVVQAPEYEIENHRARLKAGDDQKKLRKLKTKSPRDGEVGWSKKTFDRLLQAPSEPMRSQFQVSNSMVINVIARPGDGYEHFRHLLRDNHDTRAKQNKDILTTVELVRGLIAAEVVERLDDGPDKTGRRYRLTRDMPRDFALNQPLSPFALAALELLDPEAETFDLDVVSVIEAILEDPRQVLQAQRSQRRGEEIARLKAEGVDYTERMELVEEVSWPQPLRELLDSAFETYATGAPWAREFDVAPKSVVRDMVEHAMTFSDLIAVYGLGRSEGVVLRYLTDAWRTLSHTVPDAFFTEGVEDIVVWLGELIRQVDSSLVDEWAHMADPDQPVSQEVVERELAFGVSDPNALTANRRAFTIMVRNAMFRLVELFSREDEERLMAATDYLACPPDFPAALDEYFAEYDELDVSPAARGKEYFVVDASANRRWPVRQVLRDPDDERAFAFVGEVDLDASDAAGEVRLASLEFVAQ
ncbi:DEAD/DEAH box helicase [Corynebacterium atypicum]|uniref:DEAD/DEAH box helicase n=1 Tax=Corynebacterium atypicum TaxID=191610 RepID=A0ABN4DCQ8_9CORY|nr:DEAD/DEAH box helicase [Corynebacterium atypicum]AIG64021.1 DEAD/DEAH box helicase [Corynebacterium atypicum]